MRRLAAEQEVATLVLSLAGTFFNLLAFPSNGLLVSEPYPTKIR